MWEGFTALLKGFWTTLKHTTRPAVTINYPERKRSGAAIFRGRHRLYRHENGLERCIGCELCAAACPAQAIFVQPAENDPEHPVSTGERYARVYEINMIRCIFCGSCEEACPVDAIKLGAEYELSDYTRDSFVYTKEMLLEPEKFAPRRQYHEDVDLPRPGYTIGGRQLGELYGTYHTMDPDTNSDMAQSGGHRPQGEESA